MEERRGVVSVEEVEVEALFAPLQQSVPLEQLITRGVSLFLVERGVG